MRIRMPLAAASVLTVFAAGAGYAQITSNPIPEPLVKKGIAVEIKDFARLPDSRGKHGMDDVNPSGWARVSYVRQLPDGRLFANDSRGAIYWIDNNHQPHVYLDISNEFPNAVYNR